MDKSPEQAAREYRESQKYSENTSPKQKKDRLNDPMRVGTWTADCHVCHEKIHFRGRRDKAVAYFDREGWKEDRITKNPTCPACALKIVQEELAKQQKEDAEKCSDTTEKPSQN